MASLLRVEHIWTLSGILEASHSQATLPIGPVGSSALLAQGLGARLTAATLVPGDASRTLSQGRACPRVTLPAQAPSELQLCHAPQR